MRAVALTALLAAAWLHAAAEAQDSGPQVRVARLVRMLGSRSYRERTQATEELARLGAVARASLEKEANSPNPEVRHRAAALLSKLKIAELWEPSRVSLRCEKKSAQAVLSDLAQQTGNRIVPGDLYAGFEDGPLTLDVEQAPFWAVLDELCRRTGNRVRPHYDQRKRGFVAVSGSLGKFPLAYAGPVRAKITAARRIFSQELNHQTGASQVTHSFQLNVQLTWEDRFRLVAYRSQAELADAITDTHVAVRAAGKDSHPWSVATGSTRQVTMALSLNPPPTTARQFDVLRLKWPLVAVADIAELEVTDLHSPRVHEQDDLRLSVRSMEKVQEKNTDVTRHLVTLLVNRDLVLPEPRSIMVYENEIDLLDSQGRPLRKLINRWRMTGEGLKIDLTFTPDAANTDPQRLRFCYPRIRSKRTLEIVFRDVPLPHERPE